MNFLNTGQIFAASQSEGRIPEFSDCSKIIYKMGAISTAQFLKEAIFSGHCALLGSILLNKVCIPLVVNEIPPQNTFALK